jgi:hypothetical protein
MPRTVTRNAVLRWQGPRAMPAASLSRLKAAISHLATRVSGLCSDQPPNKPEVPSACLKPQQIIQNRTQSSFHPSILLPPLMGRFPYRDICRHGLPSPSARMPGLPPSQSHSGKVLRPRLLRNRYGKRVPCTMQAVSRPDRQSLDRPLNTLQHRL